MTTSVSYYIDYSFGCTPGRDASCLLSALTEQLTVHKHYLHVFREDSGDGRGTDGGLRTPR